MRPLGAKILHFAKEKKQEGYVYIFEVKAGTILPP